MKKKMFKITVAGILGACAIMPLYACDAMIVKDTDLSGYVSVDINPSVEFITDSEGKVVGVTAVNEDASILLSDLELTGMDIEDAVEEITADADELGYITDENTDVSITVAPETEDETQAKIAEEELLEKATDGVKKGCRKAEVKPDKRANELVEELKVLKEENSELYKDLTIAKLKIAKRIMEFDSEFTVEKAATMETKQLVQLLKEYLEEYKDLHTEELRQKYEEKFLEHSKKIYEKMDGIYGEEYMKDRAILRQLEILEDKFEHLLNDDDMAELTEEMKAEIEKVIGENQIVTLGDLDAYVDGLEDKLETIRENTRLTEEQEEVFERHEEQLEGLKKEVGEQMREDIDEVKDDFKARKEQMREKRAR